MYGSTLKTVAQQQLELGRKLQQRSVELSRLHILEPAKEEAKGTSTLHLEVPKRTARIASALLSMTLGGIQDPDSMVMRKLRCNANDIQHARDFLAQIELTLAKI